MKICTICNQTYSDDNLNYCLSDGGLLTKSMDDPPPTIIMNQARKTNETNWSNQSNWSNQPPPGPMSPWQNPQMQQNQNYMPPQMYQSQNQVLPIVSMVLGIVSLMGCCYGFPLGIAAAITGYIGMNNANNNPTVYGGRGFAIAGLVLGLVNLLITVIIILLAILGNIK